MRNHIRKYEQIDPQFVREVIQSLYVEDFASGKNSLEGSFELYQKLKYRFSEGGFNMRKWASNSDKLMEMIERQELPSTVKADFRLSPKRVNFVTKVGSEISLLYYLIENIAGSDFRAKFFLVTKLTLFGDSQEYLK